MNISKILSIYDPYILECSKNIKIKNVIRSKILEHKIYTGFRFIVGQEIKRQFNFFIKKNMNNIKNVIKNLSHKLHLNLSQYYLLTLSNIFIANNENKIKYFACKIYNEYDKHALLCYRAFKKLIKPELLKALNTFFIKAQHWKNNRKLTPYLLRTIKNFSYSLLNHNMNKEKINSFICPACKTLGITEFLDGNKQLYCNNCLKESARLEEELKIKYSDFLKEKYILHKSFSIHSKKGVSCNLCQKFIPLSITNSDIISCPHLNCSYSAHINTFKNKNHPIKRRNSNLVSLNKVCNNKNNSNTTNTMQEIIKSNHIPADEQLLFCEQYNKEKNILIQVINDQIQQVYRNNNHSTKIKKLLMYSAYKQMAKEYPETMVSYLVHRNQTFDFPIQPQIFQKYIDLIINFLPFSIKKNNKIINITSLTDKNLGLFLGESTFDTMVEKGHIITNKTKEVYIGGRKNKNYGPCFMGYLIDVTDIETNKSIKHLVNKYNFVNIYMKQNVNIGTKVQVTHYRISSHYEMGALVFLQRVRRKIVDSIYFRLNYKKRL